MNILIVDDLEHVVFGMRDGIDWRRAGFERVFTACSVEEAKRVMLINDIALLLCDIEMPPSNGFQLLEWARKRDESIECIFLTSHADFAYAQRAVQLGSIDYILQPARYADIAAVVGRAVERIDRKRREREQAMAGRYWQEKSVVLGEARLERFLSHRGSDVSSFLEDLSRLGYPITATGDICPILLHLHRRRAEEDVQRTRNLLQALMHRPAQNMLTAAAGDDGIFILLFGGNDQWGDAVSTMEQLLDRWSTEIGAEPRPACYLGRVVPPAGLYDQWEQLCRRMRDNVAHYGGVFALNQWEEIPGYVYMLPDMHNWAKRLEDGDCDQVRRDVLAYLGQQRDIGNCNASFLGRFYQDFIQMFFMAVGIGVQRNVYSLPEDFTFDGHLNAFSSYDDMTRMVDDVLITLARSVRSLSKNGASPIERALQYIDDNIEKDLRCSDVAEAIYVNEDHLSRLFKRELGVSLYSYIIAKKMQTAAALLKTTNLPVSIIASKVGYPNFSYFSQAFKRQMGKAPNEYRAELKK